MKDPGARITARALTGIALISFVLLTAVDAGAEVAQEGGVRVSFDGSLSPRTLPRTGSAPIAVSLSGRIASADGGPPPALKGLEIALNRSGRIDYAGLPTCALEDIQPATTKNALAACGAAKVGEGSFSADVAIPEQSPFPSEGELVAFNGRQGGRPVIFAHVYGTEPVPTSFTLPLRIHNAKGTFGTVLDAELPPVTANIASITGISLKLGRGFRGGGKAHGYLSASCPAPRGFSRVSFPLARASFSFAGGPTVRQTLIRSCRASG